MGDGRASTEIGWESIPVSQSVGPSVSLLASVSVGPSSHQSVMESQPFSEIAILVRPEVSYFIWSFILPVSQSASY